MKRKLILVCPLAPGDIVLLTAAVRDLHRTYPGRFLTDVRTHHPDLWENNPYITRLLETDPGVQIVECEYPLIDHANRLPVHALHGFKDFLNRRLRLNIQLTEFKGSIHLLREERSWASQVYELVGQNVPFWIVAGGGKYDYTIKWWDTKRFQEVVDHFRGKIQFVQVGGIGDHHPKLEGTIDLRGRTSLRQLIRLVYHAQGVLCPVTCLMHLAAAVETKRSMPRRRACVVVAGGREPAHWEAYPHHQFIHTNGALSCCAHGGCWRARTLPLGDGKEYDRPPQLCKNVVGHLPRCMDMISAQDVIRRIELYFEGKRLRFLTSEEYRAARKVVREKSKSSYDLLLTPYTAKRACEEFIEKIPSYPGKYSGRGIVICGGGFTYFTPAWVCIKMLRKLGCRLPIQLWHLNASEMDDERRQILAPLGVECVDGSEVRKQHPTRTWDGWELKPFALAHCPFREVLLLDADNVPLVNPEFLFETPAYRRHGAIFWPDIRRCKRTHAIWRITGIPFRPGPEFESGQIVMDKERCWRALSLTLWFNEHSDFFYRYILGDKETFHLAFRKLGQPYAMPKKGVKRLRATMCQHDFDGRRILQHRNLEKWNLCESNRKIRGFLLERECLEFIDQLRERWDGGMKAYCESLGKPRVAPVRVSAPLKFVALMISCPQRDHLRRQTLQSLARTDWGPEPVKVFREARPPTDFGRSIGEKTRDALVYGLNTGADYILFLEDDIIFNRYIKHNLQCWAPLRNGQVTLASLYNPCLRARAVGGFSNSIAVKPEDVYGNQGVLVSRATGQFILNHWEEVPGFPDVKFARLAERLRRPILYHVPSLVQHVGRASVWGGKFHFARDFDRYWRAALIASK